MSCRPKEFFGTEGAVGLLSWIEGMESVLHISKYSPGSQVEYVPCILQGRALTWWNNQAQTRGREAAYNLSWEEFKKLLIEEYCPKDALQILETEFWNHAMIRTDIVKYTSRFYELARLVPHMVTPEEKRVDRYIWGLAPEIRGMVTSANPSTIQAAVVLANCLTNDVIRSDGLSKGIDGGKRKQENQPRNMSGGNSDKKQVVVKNYGVAAQGPKQYNGPHPKCNKCNFHHSGNCPVCDKCKRTGHYAKYCKSGNGNNGQKAACFECGSQDHLKNACPRLNRAPNNNAGNQRGAARGRAFVIGTEEARQDPNAVIGTFLLNNHYASVLFDSGAERSFVSLEFRPLINLKSDKLKEIYIIEYANGHIFEARDIILGCTLDLADKSFNIDLIPIELKSFDVVVGMDWLTKIRAEIVCFEKIIRIPLQDG